jgi:serine/threonine protein kinase
MSQNSLLDTLAAWIDAPTPEGAPVARLPPLGTLLGGRYRLDSVLGHGAAAVAYGATDLRRGRPIAVKITHPDGIGTGDSARRDGVDLRHEAAIAMRMSHVNIVRVHAYLQEGRWEMLVMERGGGASLSSLLKTVGRLGVRETAKIGVEMLAALEHVHSKRIIHNDVKPGNILYDGERSLLFDFGAATGFDDAPTVLAGSLAYMAPERLSNLPPEPRSDLYSLACTLYTVFQGNPPFGKAAVTAIRGHLERPAPCAPGPLGAVLRTAMEKEPSNRFSSAAEMRGELTRAMERLDARLNSRHRDLVAGAVDSRKSA